MLEVLDPRLLRRLRRGSVRCVCGCGGCVDQMVADHGKPIMPPRNGVTLLGLPPEAEGYLKQFCSAVLDAAGQTVVAVDEIHRVAFSFRLAKPFRPQA